MECLDCGNCKDNQPTYYCLCQNQVVINKNYEPQEKSRKGWKKGSANYEIHRRQSRKEIDI